MKIPYVVDSLDGVDNADAYTATSDGRYVLSDLPIELPEGYAIENVDGLNNALRAAREDAKKIKSEHAKLADLAKRWEGIDPDEARKTMDKIRRGEFESKDAAESIRRELEQDFGKREAELTAKLQKLQESTLASQRDSEFAAACGVTGANSKLLAGAKAQIRGEWVEDDDGNMRPEVRIVNDRGDTVYSKHPDRRGQPMTVREFVESLRDDPDYALAFPKASGTGAKERPFTKGGRFEGLEGGALLAAARAAGYGSGGRN